MSVQEEINPAYGEEARIVLTLDDINAPVFPRRPCRVNVDTSRCIAPGPNGTSIPVGLMLPIEIIITGPRGEPDFVRIVDRRTVRTSLTWTPRGPGRHTIVLREAAHNRWFGSLNVDVVGDRTQDPEP